MSRKDHGLKTLAIKRIVVVSGYKGCETDSKKAKLTAFSPDHFGDIRVYTDPLYDNPSCFGRNKKEASVRLC